MLSQYLENATNDIKSLIQLTEEDIKDIKEARHENVFERTRLKNDLIKSFEATKTLLDNELIKLVTANKGTELSELLNEKEREGLNEMKTKLADLHKRNKEYAKFVVTISEFYNSLLDSMFPREMDGYTKAARKPASLLKVSV